MSDVFASHAAVAASAARKAGARGGGRRLRGGVTAERNAAAGAGRLAPHMGERAEALPGALVVVERARDGGGAFGVALGVATRSDRREGGVLPMGGFGWRTWRRTGERLGGEHGSTSSQRSTASSAASDTGARGAVGGVALRSTTATLGAGVPAACTAGVHGVPTAIAACAAPAVRGTGVCTATGSKGVLDIGVEVAPKPGVPGSVRRPATGGLGDSFTGRGGSDGWFSLPNPAIACGSEGVDLSAAG